MRLSIIDSYRETRETRLEAYLQRENGAIFVFLWDSIPDAASLKLLRLLIPPCLLQWRKEMRPRGKIRTRRERSPSSSLLIPRSVYMCGPLIRACRIDLSLSRSPRVMYTSEVDA